MRRFTVAHDVGDQMLLTDEYLESMVDATRRDLAAELALTLDLTITPQI